MSGVAASFRRDLALMWAGGAGAIAPLGFFFGATLLVPLAMGPERALLEAAGPPLVWIAAALAVLMTLERLFQADLEDGSLEQMLLSPTPLELIVLAKGAALWCAVGLPLALASAPAAIALQAPVAQVPLIAASVAVGAAAFIGAGLIGAAVTARGAPGRGADRADRFAVLCAAGYLRRGGGCGRGCGGGVCDPGRLRAGGDRTRADRGGGGAAASGGIGVTMPNCPLHRSCYLRRGC
ncbi:MAG: heme exporter protein CcmB [Terricaulis sp.]|nr:heme exporter protein CcmB [Terricaulis sp.]